MCQFFDCLPSALDEEDVDRMLQIMAAHALYDEWIMKKNTPKGK